VKDIEKRTADVSIELIEEIKEDENSLIFKIVPEKNTVRKLKKILKEEEELHFDVMFSVTLEGLRFFESGEGDCLGEIIINEKLTEEEV
jgi:hypothetical protein